ncbi:MAG TPA: P1 family peptidase [Firmicutes bacterium]|jgi:D-aminopeptidase|nr:P1 family peptidase [Bacillota bacterium]
MNNSRPRCRDLGISIGTLPTGPYNAITDVPGVLVGHSTIIEGEGPLVPGRGPVRTGVTAIRPHPGNLFQEKVPGAVYVINGFGKATGLAQVQELGVIETPVILTNTLSVGQAWDALCEYMLEQNPDIGVTTGTVNPLVLECNDGYLNDIRGRHVRKHHVLAALNEASSGPVTEGNVGGGTGMSCLGFKGGIGTASRCVEVGENQWSVGVLVMSNFGSMKELRISGIPVGLELEKRLGRQHKTPPGSIVIVLGTDAPVSHRQLNRIAKRCQGGLARVGSTFQNGSGDFVVAFSTANRVRHKDSSAFVEGKWLRDDSRDLGRIFAAAVEATEEAILNSLSAADTMEGRDGNTRMGLPVSMVLDILGTWKA